MLRLGIRPLLIGRIFFVHPVDEFTEKGPLIDEKNSAMDEFNETK
jgi:hypothetical protein